jgi:hypothetical protein
MVQFHDHKLINFSARGNGTSTINTVVAQFPLRIGCTNVKREFRNRIRSYKIGKGCCVFYMNTRCLTCFPDYQIAVMENYGVMDVQD